jgi:hypothetical protein
MLRSINPPTAQRQDTGMKQMLGASNVNIGKMIGTSKNINNYLPRRVLPTETKQKPKNILTKFSMGNKLKQILRKK